MLRSDRLKGVAYPTKGPAASMAVRGRRGQISRLTQTHPFSVLLRERRDLYQSSVFPESRIHVRRARRGILIHRSNPKRRGRRRRRKNEGGERNPRSVKTTNPKKYCVRPNTGVVLPRSTCDVAVTMQAQKEAPPDMQCKDKFLLQSVIAENGVTTKDITSEMVATYVQFISVS
ncbi:hypothetical protein B296_00031678 [Ensete ventricosum]|uniref:MSP domain-containing protein n=1 Tax=Ensete ventricosum TaxID=4639 RepID=A0A426YQK8_ENSVE|nr:hypothetical protein B296_00031678 [Ensete ventricosum]